MRSMHIKFKQPAGNRKHIYWLRFPRHSRRIFFQCSFFKQYTFKDRSFCRHGEATGMILIPELFQMETIPRFLIIPSPMLDTVVSGGMVIQPLSKGNFVNTTTYIKDDGGGIYCYPVQFGSTPHTGNKDAQDNIVLNPVGAPEGSPYGKQAMGIYMDGQSPNINVVHNTVSGGFSEYSSMADMIFTVIVIQLTIQLMVFIWPR